MVKSRRKESGISYRVEPASDIASLLSSVVVVVLAVVLENILNITLVSFPMRLVLVVDIHVK